MAPRPENPLDRVHPHSDGGGIHLVCREKHEHTPSCHVYGFHDFRRAFATVNAPRLKPEVLQRLMRHKSYQTTQKHYINPTSQMQDAVSDMPVRML